MNRKAKLTTSIIAVIIILILMSIAIWASTVRYGIGGDISIMSPNLQTTITGKVWGHKSHNLTEETAEILQGTTWDDETSENNFSFERLDLKFVNTYTPIVIQISIKNDEGYVDANPINVEVLNETNTEGKNFSITIESSGTAQENKIAIGETIVFTITLAVAEAGQRAGGDFSVSFLLSK